MELLDIILEENEHTGLDFKAIQYLKGNYDALLKDVIAMANADIRGDRQIILGVKQRPDGSRDIIGIEDFVDDATYQQIVSENIEPQLTIKYYPFRYESKTVGILEIHSADDPPYMMKKSYQSDKGRSIKEGDSWIRIGTSQKLLTRQHINRYIKRAIDRHVNDKYFTGEVEVTLTNEVTGDSTLRVEQLLEFPSELAANRIRDAIKKKESLPAVEKLPDIPYGLKPLTLNLSPLTSSRKPYEERDMDTLVQNLRNVEEDYREEDLYYLFEQKSNKVNVLIFNKNNRYLEDASIKIIISKHEGLLIADQVHEKPEYSGPFSSKTIRPFSWDYRNYPHFDESENEYVFMEDLGDIKHGLETQVFKVPLRILISDNYGQETLPVKCLIYGKNLLTPIELNLKVQVKS